MTRLEQIKSEVAKLTDAEILALADWLSEQHAEAWDRQIEQDARAGRLDRLAEEALRDYEGGRCSDL